MAVRSLSTKLVHVKNAAVAVVVAAAVEVVAVVTVVAVVAEAAAVVAGIATKLRLPHF